MLAPVSVVVLGACASEPDWAKLDLEAAAAPTTPKGADGAAAACSSGEGGDDKPGIDGVDVSKLDACCPDPGKAHCVPTDKLSSTMQKSLDSCGGGFCVPDSLITGQAIRQCDSGFGEGVCVSKCVKAVRDKASLLKQQSCEAGELCAPCISPLDGERTGACELGGGSSSAPKKDCAKPEEAKKDGTAPAGKGGFADCCSAQGACVPESAVPANQKDKLGPKECQSGSLCAPKEFLDDNYKPPTCKGEGLTGDYEGVCLSNCVEYDFLESLFSEQGSCDENHRCIPCKTPFGSDSGAPGCK